MGINPPWLASDNEISLPFQRVELQTSQKMKPHPKAATGLPSCHTTWEKEREMASEFLCVHTVCTPLLALVFPDVCLSPLIHLMEWRNILCAIINLSCKISPKCSKWEILIYFLADICGESKRTSWQIILSRQRKQKNYEKATNA